MCGKIQIHKNTTLSIRVCNTIMNVNLFLLTCLPTHIIKLWMGLWRVFTIAPAAWHFSVNNYSSIYSPKNLNYCTQTYECEFVLVNMFTNAHYKALNGSPKSVHHSTSVAFLRKQLLLSPLWIFYSSLCEFSWQLLVKGAALHNPTYPSITFKCLEMPAPA